MLRRIGTWVVLLVVAATASEGMGALIASTGFENETPASQYADTGNQAVDHDLVNNVGESPVDSTSSSTTAGDLGFDASYVNTRNDVGLTDGDFVGVTSFTGTVGSYVEGSQGYQMSDADGKMVLEFDAVDNGGGALFVGLQLFVQSTGWETGSPSDQITVVVSTDQGDVTLLDTAGGDIDDLNIEDEWMLLTADLTGKTNAVLTVTLDSNSGNEAIYLDDVRFGTTVTDVPEPASLALLALGGLAVIRRR